MALRTRTRKAETALPKIVERTADYQRSREIASEHGGTLIRLERLPQLLNDPRFIKSIQGTESYKIRGYTCFLTDTVGTDLEGYYRINPQGKTLKEMFQIISNDFDSKVQAVPFNKRAYFCKGKQPLIVGVRLWDINSERLSVNGYGRSGFVAPIVVVEQNSNQAKPTKAPNGVIVPTGQFNAAKEAFRKVEPLLKAANYPDLADTFRAVFGE